jgi:hypothetical protein
MDIVLLIYTLTATPYIRFNVHRDSTYASYIYFVSWCQVSGCLSFKVRDQLFDDGRVNGSIIFRDFVLSVYYVYDTINNTTSNLSI